MTEKEMLDILKPYQLKHKIYLHSISGYTTDKAYRYTFIDSLGINIIINPIDKSFEFVYIVDKIYRLSSNNMSPIDYKDHFKNNYYRFRECVMKIRQFVDKDRNLF